MAGEFGTTYGAGDYSLRGGGLTGAVDGKSFLASIWINTTSTAAEYLLFSTGIKTGIFIASGTNVQYWFENVGGSRIYFFRSGIANNPIDGTWHHVLASGTTGGAGPLIYVDDTENTPVVTNDVDDDIDFTVADWSIAADTGGASSFRGSISELYFTNEFLDISVEANRRKFIDASGNPATLGGDGSNPTGTAPLIYAPDGNAVNNLGSGGDFTLTGTVERIAGPGGAAEPSFAPKILLLLD